MDKITRVAVWGTFDFLHEWHINFLKEAARLGDLIIKMPDKIPKLNHYRLEAGRLKSRLEAA